MEIKIVLSLVLIVLVQNIWANCPEPKCDTDLERNTLWAHDNPYKFWQCRPWLGGIWTPVEHDCAKGGILFSFPHQVCVWEADWVDTCGSGRPTTIGPIYPTTDDIGQVTDDETNPDNCSPPTCDTDLARNTLWPHSEKTKFWQCAPVHGVTWGPVERPCGPETWFCKKHQVCIWPADWTEADCGCGNNGGVTEAPTDGPSTTSDDDITTDDVGEVTGTEDVSGDCHRPVCDTDLARNTLWPHSEKTKFWQCAPADGVTWEPEEMPCGPKTWFCKKYQVCIHPENWTEADCGCGNNGGVTEAPSTTSDDDITTDDAGEATVTEDVSGDCPIPVCDTDLERNTLWPHSEKTKFWQCAPAHGVTWAAVERPCAPAPTWFCKKKQVCIWPVDWNEKDCGCGDGGMTQSTEEEPITTPEITTTEATTTPSSTTTDSAPPVEGECEVVPDCRTENLLMLWPHVDKITYWQCELRVTSEGAKWLRVQKKCDKHLNNEQMKFNFLDQVCVLPDKWVDYCVDPTNPGLCGEPRCIEQELTMKFPHSNPRKWYTCTGVSISEVHTCPKDTLYHHQKLKCVDPCDWVDPCDNVE